MQHIDFYKFSYKTTKQVIMATAINVDKESTYGKKEGWFALLQKGKYQSFEFPILFKQEEGFRKWDILLTYTGSLFLISEKMKALFQKENFTGWQTFPIKLIDKTGEEIPGYHGLSVLGKCGPVDFSKCQTIERPHPFIVEGIERICKGLYVGLDEWDGSDFFSPEGHSGTIVTKRVAKAIEKNKFTNVELINLFDWEMPEFGVKI